MSVLKFNGPGGTVYQTFATSSRGRAGVADVGCGKVRVRIEPVDDNVAQAMRAELPDWTRPRPENRRLSIIAEKGVGEEAAVAKAQRALGISVPDPRVAQAAAQAKELAEALAAVNA